MGATDETNAPPAENGTSAPTEIKKEATSAPTEIKKEATSAPTEIKKEATSAPPAAENGAKPIDDRDRTDQNDRYSLKVKSEFVLSERAPNLTPLEKVEDTRGAKVDDRDRQSGKKRKKSKGQNKKRPRDARQDDSEKVCMSAIRGDKCPFGDGCKFSHDIKAYMATRPTDITQVDGCPNYKLHGYCVFGVACRFGGCHISKTGENIHKDAVDTPGVKPDVPLQETSINSLPRDVQILLRKNKYDFKCKRHFEAKKEAPKEGEADKIEPPKTLETATPVELKTRKIIDFSNKVYVAPLTTVGNLPFRRMMKKFGADITCGEMAIATCLLEGKPSEWALLKRHPEEDVFGVQVAAAHPDQYTRACELIEEFCTVDFVDLNLGCPLDLVCSKGAGAALMNRERKLKASLEGINKTLSCPFTVKMRTGWDMSKPFAVCTELIWLVLLCCSLFLLTFHVCFTILQHQLVPKIQSWGIDGIGAFMVS
jgi:tRNA-dihydrouridine synthase 3